MNERYFESEDEKKGFTKEFASIIKQRILDEARDDGKHDIEVMRNWRSWGSWFSWGSPVGFSIFLLSIGGFLLLLHIAGLIR